MAEKQKKKKETKPIENGRNGKGQFGEGNQCAAGTHNVKATQISRELKKALLEAVSVEDVKKIVQKLVRQAKHGEIAAAKELFDRCLGKPLQTHEIDVEIKTYTPEQCDTIREFLAGRCVNADS